MIFCQNIIEQQASFKGIYSSCLVGSFLQGYIQCLSCIKLPSRVFTSCKSFPFKPSISPGQTQEVEFGHGLVSDDVLDRPTIVICDTRRDALGFKGIEEVLTIVILFGTNEDDGIGKLLKAIEMLALACVIGPNIEILDKIVTKCVECKV